LVGSTIASAEVATVLTGWDSIETILSWYHHGVQAHL
jgi:hypothetical protein